jgi:hypothetical protein
VVETGRRVSERKAREAIGTGNNSTDSSDSVTVRPLGSYRYTPCLCVCVCVCLQLLSNVSYSRSRIAVPTLKTAARNRS